MKKNKTSTIKNNLYFLKLLFKISPSRVLLHFFDKLLGFAMWTFESVVFMQYLFGANEKARSFTEVVCFIWFAVALNMGSKAFSAWYQNYFMPKTDIEIHYQLNTMLFQKVQTVDLSCYETPEFYNTYTKAATEASDRAKSVLDNSALLVSAFLSSAFVIYTMCEITWWSVIFIALPLLGNLYFGKKRGKVMFELGQDSIPSRRRMDYVNRVVFFRKYAGEMRLTNVFQVIKEIYEKAVQESIEVSRKHAFKRGFYQVLQFVLSLVIGFEGMWVCAVILAIREKITLGELAVLLNAIVSVYWMLNDFESALSNSFTNSCFIDNLKAFFQYEPKIDESAGGLVPPKQVECIEFRNVSFRYPGQERYVLEHINLTMYRGVRHALVGINGSGKSTLIKLILRFYDPTEGQILLNGVDIREFDIKQYRQKIGVAFQDFALFAATIVENVLLHEVQSDADKVEAVQALKDSDIYDKIQTLKYKEDTLLTREFDNEGAELSGGQRQKIAIARAFAKKAPIVILDEPSSALDPIAEFKMFETINHLCEGEDKLSIIISHRLSSAAMCEKIIVLEKGRLLEQGSHAELMKADGAYAYMFRKQAENYQVEEATYA